MIHYVTSWKTGDIGGGLNEAIALLPDDAWVCVRDGDTLFLGPRWGEQIEQIAARAEAEGYGLVGCVTNRLRAAYQLHDGVLSGEPDIGRHVAVAAERWNAHGAAIAALPSGPVAGMLMLFRKSEWAAHPFVEKSIYFDQAFTQAARERGVRVGIAQGLYLFHLYRWGKPNPTGYVGHLP